MSNLQAKVKRDITSNIFNGVDECLKQRESTTNSDDNEESSKQESDKLEGNVSRDDILQWQVQDVVQWALQSNEFTDDVIKCLQLEQIDGQVLLSLTEDDVRDFRYRLNYSLRFGELKKLWNYIYDLQEKCHQPFNVNAQHMQSIQQQQQHIHYSTQGNSRNNINFGPDGSPVHQHYYHNHRHMQRNTSIGGVQTFNGRNCNFPVGLHFDAFNDCESCAPEVFSVPEGCSANIPPEFFKTAISVGYSFVVTWITSFVMVIVHERVPDMKRYPPLPDIFLDNVPHIPWAFHMCEITGTLLFSIWICVCIFHKYRMVILRRFFALAGTVFLLRCVTMLITSLSVPGTHLQCNQNDYAIDDTSLTLAEAIYLRISRAYTIWSGLGMSIQGVRTCGDYMFSGHTVALTQLNFFITEYTPRNLYFLHTLSWLLNMFGIFFILAAHEHYSIDVFVAFYITSRLFLYYHTLANNQALMQRDSNRTRIWFPMFSYFESSVGGIIPNEFDSVSEIMEQLLHLLMELKDTIMLTTYRLWLEAPHLKITPRNVMFVPREARTRNQQRNAATSTTIPSGTSTPTMAPTTKQGEYIYNNDNKDEKQTAESSSKTEETQNTTVDRLNNFNSKNQVGLSKSHYEYQNYNMQEKQTVSNNNFQNAERLLSNNKKLS